MQSDNKRIVKNTGFLYVRMLVMMFINLYTSRVVLDQLGISDYGTYNAVGSLVMMFSFIQGSLASSASRFFSYEIGGGDEKSLNKVFCMSMNVHIIFAIFVFIFAETIGLWYVYNEMVIPPGRFAAAVTVYHISAINAMLAIMLVPFNSMIISQERMKAFAYLSIFESLAKFSIAVYLIYTGFDKLVVYGLCLCLIQFLIQSLYMIYCKRDFAATRYHLLWDKKIFKEIFGFAGWSLVSYIGTLVSQMMNLLLNAFFGTIVNAARAVSVQVQNTIIGFVANFQIALNPQIVKSYAAKNLGRVFHLVDMSMKISFSLLFIIMFPLLVNIDFVLNLWLKEVPQYTDELVVLIGINAILSIMQNPLNVITEAANKLKKYNIINSIYNVMQIPIWYILLKVTHNVYLVFIVQIAFSFFGYFIRLWLVHGISQIPVGRPLWLYGKTTITIILAAIIGYMLMNTITDDVLGFFVKCFIATLLSLPCCWYFILDKPDRQPVLEFIQKKIHKA